MTTPVVEPAPGLVGMVAGDVPIVDKHGNPDVMIWGRDDDALLPARAGVYPGMSDQTYFRRLVFDPQSLTYFEALSHSGAKLLLPPSTPAHFRAAMDAPEKRSRAFDEGHAAHAMLLGKGAQPVMVPVTGWMTKDGKEAAPGWKTIEAKAAVQAVEDAGNIALTPKQYQMVQDMADALANHKAAAELLTDPAVETEVAMYAQDLPTGVWLTGKADMFAPTWIGDYKSTAKRATAWDFAKSCIDFGYDVQHEWYLALAQALGFPMPDGFRFIVQEKTPPYEVAVFTLDLEFRSIGAEKMRAAIDLYAQCLDSDTWPGYPDQTIEIAPPAWARPARIAGVVDDDLYQELRSYLAMQPNED